jgi:hypothetical protein
MVCIWKTDLWPGLCAQVAGGRFPMGVHLRGRPSHGNGRNDNTRAYLAPFLTGPRLRVRVYPPSQISTALQPWIYAVRAPRKGFAHHFAVA